MAHPNHHLHASSKLFVDPQRPPPARHRLGRRRFLSDIGRGTLAVTILGVSACSDDDTDDADDTDDRRSAGTDAADTGSDTTATTTPAAEPVSWHRVNLGFVSAYVLVRGREAAIVDTGTAGSETAIAQTLSDLGVDWADVDHVLLTHFHPDHAGSTSAVLETADRATGYAGEADIPAIRSPRPLRAVGDGDEIFGLQIIATPGHTPGHISVLDPDGGFLVAGDALTTDATGVAGPNEGFTADLPRAHDSVRKLAELTFADVLAGHGDPVEGDGDTQVAALAATL
jgi:glyoxylase-like metal-dependent hydrolase (beta-lactamase superfamily II)